MRTIAQVLEAHGIPMRNKQINCPVHEDNTPSCSVNRPDDETGFVHCFTCQWSADAAGLEAALSGRQVGEVLAEWSGGRVSRSTVRRTPPHVMRQEIWLEWVDLSQRYIEEMRQIESDPDLRDVALDQVQGMFDEFNDALRPRDPEQAPPPAKVRAWLPVAERKLQRWLDRWAA